ncbi:polysaccharide pyruvyl transferase family protein [Rapidithrix thailandica]|uniref:Polysaccharide pyruvyl transferase family protein n=1 Tax=Rapidithrix thailandica TaxID=413964 RepID=A0AAW9RSK2_9BACT
MLQKLKSHKFYHHAFDLYHTFLWERRRSNLTKPFVVNFQANDICNSKCTMCFIWQKKKDVEITPEEFGKILSDPLFSEVRHIGITGGEPTLRKDLPELYEVACKTLPKLKGMSSITNAIQKKQVIDRLEKSAEVCHRLGKSFSFMVSLDGVGKVHDRVRGRTKNFESALEVIRHFQTTTEIPVSIGCTVTKDNVWHVDEMLEFLKENGIYGRFRVAEFIRRLYNDNAVEIIRNFTEEEAYHLALFFKKLELTYETNPTYQRTYRSIQHMLMGGQRLIGCPYQSEAISLDCRGNVAYCAPKSKNIGNSLEGSAETFYASNLEERERIQQEDCSECIHDYHSPASWKEQRKLAQGFFYKTVFSHKYATWAAKLLIPKVKNTTAYSGRRILITGWYGTETVGDKAILGGIVDAYKKQFPEVSLAVSSFYPFVTKHTLKELNIQADVVPVSSPAFLEECGKADEVVMGGGPLMGIGALSIPYLAFKAAKKNGKKTVVFGCGLGPLNEEKYIKTVRKILQLADEVKLRDKASVAWAQRLTQRNDIQQINDPAHGYVERIASRIHITKKKAYLACFLREWSVEYKGDLSGQAFINLKEFFEAKLSKQIKELCREKGLIPSFYSMHNFVVGGDDREFYRQFTKKYFQGEKYYIENRPATVEGNLRIMKESAYCLSMRFHSVVFAKAAGVDFFALDYTNGGKVYNFLKDNQLDHRMIRLHDFVKQTDFSLVKHFNLIEH